LRFGHFELPAMRGDIELLRRLADFCIARDFPQLQGQGEALCAGWFAEGCGRSARLASEWMRVGFVHGVLNTDNMSILGLTIDYGPYGWIEPYDPDWTPNTTDAAGRRYRFGWQPRVAYWNLGQLARALSPLFADAPPLQDGLARFGEAYAAAERDITARKLGLAECRDGDVGLVRDLHRLLHECEIDMTLWFRALADVDPDAPALRPMEHAFYDPAKRAAGEGGLQDWLGRYAARLRDDPLPPEARRERMCLANPKYVLRNWLAQEAIDRAGEGDMAGVDELLDVLRRPCEE